VYTANPHLVSKVWVDGAHLLDDQQHPNLDKCKQQKFQLKNVPLISIYANTISNKMVLINVVNDAPQHLAVVTSEEQTGNQRK